MIKLLITGGCGFIGSNLTKFLIDNTDWDINILDNLSTGHLSDIKDLEGFGERISFIQGDIRKLSDISFSIKGCSYVINLAAQTNVMNSIEDPFNDESVNIKGLLNLLRFSKKENITKFIQASSAAALGEVEMPINEKKIPRPLSPYGSSKLAGEAYCSSFAESYGLHSVVLRFSNVYGPKSYHKGSVIAKFFKRILEGKELEIYGDGNQSRDFVYVYDICRAIYLALTKKTLKFDIFQLGTGKETQINTLIKIINNILKEKNYKLPKLKFTSPRPGEIYRNYTDIKKAKKKLGYRVKYDLYEGLTKTFDWFLNDN
jgi:UDP-glucose 4-epimerase